MLLGRVMTGNHALGTNVSIGNMAGIWNVITTIATKNVNVIASVMEH